MTYPRLITRRRSLLGPPLAVNRGIDKKQYPAKMANTKSVLKLLDKVGAPAEFSKIDWQQAYKHLGK